MSKIIVAGSINMDVVAGVAAHPVPGETIFGRDLQFIPGGKGANQAVAAARLNGDVYLIGKVGKDAFGGQLLEFLRSESMNTEYVTQSDNASGTALILVDDNSENTIVVISGSNMDVSPDDVAEIDIVSDDIALAPFEVPQETILALFERAKSAGATTILNPAPATDFIPKLQEMVDILIVNETELAFFAGESAVSEDLETLQNQAKQFRSRDTQIIVMTLGAKGVFCVQSDETIYIEGRSVKAVDTTAAGDCFTGALAVALSEGQPLAEALHFANIAASLAVQTKGASSSLPMRDDVDNDFPY